MSEQNAIHQMAPALLVIVTDFDRVKKVKELMGDSLVRFMYNVKAVGTAKSELLDVLGLGSVEKAMIGCLMPSFRVPEIMRRVADGLEVDRPGKGIAFSISLSCVSGSISRLFDEERLKKLIDTLEPEKRERLSDMLKIISESQEFSDKKNDLEGLKEEMEDKMEMPNEAEFDLIFSVVNVGYSDELMEAAREAGARGGTIIHARRTGPDEAVKFFGISLQAEKEIVAILTKRDMRNAIMKAISQSCGLTTEAAGIVFSVPVDGVAGIA